MDFNQDNFSLFGLAPAFAVDGAALDKAYRDLQAEFHPDKFAHAGEAEQRQAVQWSTRINEAYQALKNPFSRADYLLGLHGIHAMDASNTAMPHDFLIQQMAWREAMMAIVDASDYEGLQELEKAAKTEAGHLLAVLGEQIDGLHDYPAAAETLRKYRFMEKFLADIANAYEELD